VSIKNGKGEWKKNRKRGAMLKFRHSPSFSIFSSLKSNIYNNHIVALMLMDIC
jgi:hypothetical protein